MEREREGGRGVIESVVEKERAGAGKGKNKRTQRLNQDDECGRVKRR